MSGSTNDIGNIIDLLGVAANKIESLEKENRDLQKKVRDNEVWAQATTLVVEKIGDRLEEVEGQLTVCLDWMSKQAEREVAKVKGEEVPDRTATKN